MNTAADPGKLPAMSNPLLDRIDDRMKALNLNDSSAASKAELSVDTIRDLRRNKRKNLRIDTLAKLATALETSVGWLSGDVDAAPPASNAPMEGGAPLPDLGSPVRLADVALPSRQQMRDDVRVLGTALGSVVHHVEGFHFEGGQIDTVRRPPALAGAKDLYAIYVEGDSMFPAHPAGELRFVHPHRPCQVGDTVVVVTRNYNDDPGQAYIKVLKKRATGTIYLQQYNPVAVIEIPMKYVISVHRVLTMSELFGV